MTWRDDLLRVTLADGRRLIGASFRGVTFLVESSERTGGRRTVTHEFPLRDDPFVEDLGRRARVFSVEGYVLGDDYVRQRDALLAALEDESGPGELVHPYHGVRRAICTGCTVRDTKQDGGVAVFALEFAESPSAAPAPIESPDLSAQVEDAATAVVTAASDELVESYDVDGQPAFALESLADDVEATAEALRDGLLPLADTAQEAALLNAELDLLIANASSLVREPAELLVELVEALDALADTAAGAPREIMLAFLAAAETVGSIELASETTSTRTIERANQVALSAGLRQVLVARAAMLAVLVEYETLEDAQADSALIISLLDVEAGTAGTTAYPALMQLRAEVARAVPGDAVLARVLTHEQRTAIPSLLLTYQLYGDLSRESDVIARNGTRHPGFMGGTLRVLSNV